MRLRSAPFVAVMLGLLASGTLSAEDGVEFSEKKIRPALVEHCYSCHSTDFKSGCNSVPRSPRAVPM